MGASEGSNSDGSAGGIREGRPGGALTGAYDNDPDSPTYGQRVGPTQATPNRTDLPFSTALDIYNNPLSRKATGAERAKSFAQLALPGGSIIGLGRAIGATFTDPDAKAPGPDAFGDDGGSDAPKQQGKLAAASNATAAKKPIASVVSTKSTSPPASVSNAKLGTATPTRKLNTTRAPLSFSTGAFKTALGS